MPVLAVFAEIAEAWADVMPVLSLFTTICPASADVMPVLAVFAEIAEAWADVIVTVLPANAVPAVAPSSSAVNLLPLTVIPLPAKDDKASVPKTSSLFSNFNPPTVAMPSTCNFPVIYSDP